MSLSIKSLQARSRAMHAPSSIHTQDALAIRSPVWRDTVQVVVMRARPTLTGEAVRIARPMSAFASDLFALFAGSHTPNATPMSQVRGAYEAIACRPSVGQNLSARA